MAVPPRINYFLHAGAARRYAAHRPYFHPVVVERIVRFTGCAEFGRALDVACGTGQSTRALAAVAREISALDSSREMLALAPALPNVNYHHGPAEALPFPDAAFDLATVGMGFHWFEQERFLREAARVLKPGGWLVIYNNVFMGDMRECPGLKHWVETRYLPKYSTPPRAREKLTAEFAAAGGFDLAGRENFPNEVAMTREQLAGFFLSQSNVIAFVEEGNEAVDDVAAWLNREITPFFGERASGTLRFANDVWYLRKNP